jgi:signal transduction histidine kinase
MFHSLRLQLTTSSVLKMLALIALISGSLYASTIYYLDYVTDQALRETMALEFQSLGLPLPRDLIEVQDSVPIISQLEESHDGEDAVELVMHLDGQGGLALNSSDASHLRPDPNIPDPAAAQAARIAGSDIRTIYTGQGIHVRLFTYRLPPGGRAAFLQMGRVLTDDDRIKHRLLLTLFAVGIVLTVGSGSVSWWLTGRSLTSTRNAWDKQQAFVANASHELRTPLTLIRASTQVLQLGLEPNSSKRLLLDDVLDETDYMSRLVDDLLVLSRLDAGQLELDLSTIVLSDLLPKIARPFASLARERGVSVNVNRTEGIVLADPIRLRQVLLIVLDNSLRHTPAGGRITLDSKVRDGAVHIAIADTGKGIAPEDLPHVFDRFYKVDSSRGDRRSAGLGLSIAKPLIELHGGEMKIYSTYGVRTLVTITLPAQIAPQTAQQVGELVPKSASS